MENDETESLYSIDPTNLKDNGPVSKSAPGEKPFLHFRGV